MPVQTPPQRITLMLWFDQQADEAVALYTSIFKNSRVLATTATPRRRSRPPAGPPDRS